MKLSRQIYLKVIKVRPPTERKTHCLFPPPCYPQRFGVLVLFGKQHEHQQVTQVGGLCARPVRLPDTGREEKNVPVISLLSQWDMRNTNHNTMSERRAQQLLAFYSQEPCVCDR